jgi:hypothetical protein
LRHGLPSFGGSAQSLRRDLAEFLLRNPNLEIAGDTLEEWVRWDANTSVRAYAQRMALSGWGGGIEMACFANKFSVNVHVYEAMRGYSAEYKRISCFNSPHARKTVHVLYQGRAHYDALQPNR